MREALASVLLVLLLQTDSGIASAQTSPNDPCTTGGCDVVTHCIATHDVDMWRIDRPDPRLPLTAYPAVRLRPHDRVYLHALGWVHMKHSTLSGDIWKDYVYPTGDNAERLYHGTFWLPGATPGPIRFAQAEHAWFDVSSLPFDGDSSA